MASSSHLRNDYLREVVGADRAVRLISELGPPVLSEDVKAQEATEKPLCPQGPPLSCPSGGKCLYHGSGMDTSSFRQVPTSTRSLMDF